MKILIGRRMLLALLSDFEVIRHTFSGLYHVHGFMPGGWVLSLILVNTLQLELVENECLVSLS